MYQVAPDRRLLLAQALAARRNLPAGQAAYQAELAPQAVSLRLAQGVRAANHLAEPDHQPVPVGYLAALVRHRAHDLAVLQRVAVPLRRSLEGLAARVREQAQPLLRHQQNLSALVRVPRESKLRLPISRSFRWTLNSILQGWRLSSLP